MRTIRNGSGSRVFFGRMISVCRRVPSRIGIMASIWSKAGFGAAAKASEIVARAASSFMIALFLVEQIERNFDRRAGNP